MKNILSFVVWGILGAGVEAADWPRWLGPKGDGTSPETGLRTKWPAGGPRVLWEAPGGDGYSSIAVVGPTVYTLAQRGKDELAIALDAGTGKERWATPIGPAFKNKYGNGPRSTPWVEGERVFVQSVNGPLVCLNAATGAIVWQNDLLKEYSGKNITWGLSASPVVADGKVLAIPGGKGAGVAAFDAASGQLLWKTGNDRPAYASPVVVEIGGRKQAIFFTAFGLVAVALENGSELWRQPWKTEFDCNIATPLVIDGNKLFVSSGEGNGCVLYQLNAADAPKVVWESKGKKSVMINYWATSIAHDGHLYGFAGEFDKAIHLRCVDLKDGSVRWTKEDFGKGAASLADGHLFIAAKTGDVIVVRATPAGYEEVSRAKLLGENRTAPAIANGKLYLRDLSKVVCVDLAK